MPPETAMQQSASGETSARPLDTIYSAQQRACAMSNIDPKVIASASGFSGSLKLPAGGEYALSFTSAGAFTATLQRLAGDGVKWSDVYDSAGVVTVNSASGRQGFIAAAGTYRMNVTSYTSPVTMWAIGV